MRLIINLVTRGRPQLVKSTLDRTLPNIANPDTLIMVSADIDDMPTVEFIHHHFGKHTNVKLSIKPREDATSAKYNRALEFEPDLIGNLSDYTPIVTPGFDTKIIETAKLFPDGIGVVVNPMRNASFSDMYVMTKPLYKLLGYYSPPYFRYWFWDHWVDEIARRIDRMALCDFALEYPPGGKPQTQNLRELAWWGTWFDAAYRMRREQAAKIMLAMDEPEWRKLILIGNAPLHEFRSRWINDNVRGQARQLEGYGVTHAPDEGYTKCRQAAAAMIDELLATMPAQEANAYRTALLPPDNIVALPRVG
jgi:hypothetical protein